MSDLLPIMADSGHSTEPICSTCGGECCKRAPGIAHPDDFREITVEVLADLFASGLWSIDWWEGEEQKYYVRPATVDAAGGSPYDPSWGGRCVMLTDAGCKFDFENRPHQCRHLKPVETMQCRGEFGKEEYGEAWRPYWELIHKAASLAEEME